MSLSPAFVPWAIIAATLGLVAGGVLWLVQPGPLQRLLARAQPGDAVALWLAYAVAYHLAFLAAFRAVVGPLLALWGLCAALGLYVVTARLSGPRAADWRFGLVVLAWAGTIAAGQNYVDQTAADAALLRERPRAVVGTAPETLRPLWRVALLTRVQAPARQATQAVLTELLEPAPPDPGALAAFRAGWVPRLLDAYAQEVRKLRTYHWLQVALLALALVGWGFGLRPGAPGPPGSA